MFIGRKQNTDLISMTGQALKTKNEPTNVKSEHKSKKKEIYILNREAYMTRPDPS